MKKYILLFSCLAVTGCGETLKAAGLIDRDPTCLERVAIQSTTIDAVHAELRQYNLAGVITPSQAQIGLDALRSADKLNATAENLCQLDEVLAEDRLLQAAEVFTEASMLVRKARTENPDL